MALVAEAITDSQTYFRELTRVISEAEENHGSSHLESFICFDWIIQLGVEGISKQIKALSDIEVADLQTELGVISSYLNKRYESLNPRAGHDEWRGKTIEEIKSLRQLLATKLE